MSWKHSGIKLCINLPQCALNQPLLNGSIWTQALVLNAVTPKPSYLPSDSRSHTRASHSPLSPFSCVFFFLYVFIFGQGQQIDDGVTDWQCILGKARNMVINSGRFSFTMANCLAVRGVGACCCSATASAGSGATIKLRRGGRLSKHWIARIKNSGKFNKVLQKGKTCLSEGKSPRVF